MNLPPPILSTKRTDLVEEYLLLWGTATVGPVGGRPDAGEVLTDVKDSLEDLVDGKPRYMAVQGLVGVPWWFVGILHLLECGGDFRRHLHNGDPLERPTVNVPKGRPPGAGPWTWEASAVDALTLKGWGPDQVLRLGDGEPDWTLPTSLWRFEAWNGFGYRGKGLRSPYLWAGSSLEQPGRYSADGVFAKNLWSAQIGAGTVLKTALAAGIVQNTEFLGSVSC